MLPQRGKLPRAVGDLGRKGGQTARSAAERDICNENGIYKESFATNASPWPALESTP